MKLIIGNKNYSSWSLRSWLLLTHFELDFEEINVSLRSEELNARLGEYSPSQRVPVLEDGATRVWDTLAIAEYINEKLDGAAWPSKTQERAYARSISAEMHAGFTALRNAMPMNIRAKRGVELSQAVQRDLQRIEMIFGGTRLSYSTQGPWLAGAFSIADCMYAPVASRLKTYGISLNQQAEEYVEMIHELPAMKQWISAALAESEVIPEDEAGVDIV